MYKILHAFGYIITLISVIKKIFIIDVIVSLVKLLMCYAFLVNSGALLEQKSFRFTAISDMHVNNGH